jgi:hypothetical protein
VPASPKCGNSFFWSLLSHEVPEANCDVSHPGGSAGRDSGFGDDRTATQHEARHIH